MESEMRLIKNLTLSSIVLVTLALCGIQETQAQSAKPADVLLVVETAQNELRLMFAADLSEPPAPPSLATAPRRPRHVYFKAREVYQRVQLLRFLNGLPENPLPDVPAREIRPTEVRELVTNILKDIQDVKGMYFISETAVEASKKENVTPTDVYKALVYTNRMIDQLDTPAIVPNDVYRVALSVLEEARVIMRNQQPNAREVALATDARGKKPSDVYQSGEELLELVKDITSENETYTIPNGVVLPTTPTGNITPTHVISLMSNTLAELSAVKAKLGIAESAANQPPQSGKTPSNVYDVIETAKTVLGGLQ